MPIYKIKLLNRKEIARHTMMVEFEKPVGFNFTPGQYGGFTLIDPPETDAGGNTRRFSLLSTPEDPFIAIATRIQQSAFKRVLKTMPLQSEIKLAGPTGNFTLHEDVTIPAVFIAGGIGVVPFHSMIKHALATRSVQQLFLFYGNQQPADAAFLAELTQMAEALPSFKFIPTMAEGGADWQGETGYITDSMLKRYIVDLHAPIYYVCGSPVMV